MTSDIEGIAEGERRIAAFDDWSKIEDRECNHVYRYGGSGARRHRPQDSLTLGQGDPYVRRTSSCTCGDRSSAG